jgi:hypothetical protein
MICGFVPNEFSRKCRRNVINFLSLDNHLEVGGRVALGSDTFGFKWGYFDCWLKLRREET